MRNAFLLTFAGVCLAIALALAWTLGLTLFYPKGLLASYIVERSDLIKAHIDYLMMAQFLLIFALLFRQYRIDPPLWVIGASCYGAFFNPLGFLARALRPKAVIVSAVASEAHFPLQAGVSFTLTTVGFLASMALIAHAAWKSARLAENGVGQV